MKYSKKPRLIILFSGILLGAVILGALFLGAGVGVGKGVGKDISVNENRNSQPNINKKKCQIIKVSRKDVGLSSITKLDFSKFTLNNRINELLLKEKQYINDDYFRGIINDDNILIISDRFKEKVIDEVKVKMSIKEAIDILGPPSIKGKIGIYYKTKEYYLGLIGSNQIEEIAFIKSSNSYNRDIFYKILSGLETNKAETVLSEKMDNREIKKFFNNIGHIHGGGMYYSSSNGIVINEFSDDNYIKVYNNFEGDLYNIVDGKSIFPISFDNSDFLVNEIEFAINNYKITNKRFDEEGVISPGGKREFLYDWNNSESTYFTIRTLDNTRPDCFYVVMANDYYWLNDDYIIYIDFIDSKPYVFNVNKMEDGAIEVSDNDCAAAFTQGTWKE